jgi:hypothetical protein
MIRNRAITAPAFAVAALSALALGACGSETIDTADLEGKLTDQLGRSAGVSPKGVECPEDITVEKGRTFDCTLTAPNGDQVRVDVTLTNDEGGFRAVVPPQQFN